MRTANRSSIARVRHKFVTGRNSDVPRPSKLQRRRITCKLAVLLGIAAETAQALAHMEKALHAAGSSKERVVKCLVFLADMADR